MSSPCPVLFTRPQSHVHLTGHAPFHLDPYRIRFTIHKQVTLSSVRTAPPLPHHFPLILTFIPPVNPEISSGLPIPELNRYPQPGSREERYATPATQASDVAFNPVRGFQNRGIYEGYAENLFLLIQYFKRDVCTSRPGSNVCLRTGVDVIFLVFA